MSKVVMSISVSRQYTELLKQLSLITRISVSQIAEFALNDFLITGVEIPEMCNKLTNKYNEVIGYDCN